MFVIQKYIELGKRRKPKKKMRKENWKFISFKSFFLRNSIYFITINSLSLSLIILLISSNDLTIFVVVVVVFIRFRWWRKKIRCECTLNSLMAWSWSNERWMAATIIYFLCIGNRISKIHCYDYYIENKDTEFNESSRISSSSSGRIQQQSMILYRENMIQCSRYGNWCLWKKNPISMRRSRHEELDLVSFFILSPMYGFYY